jgi:predicted P-loop ATPase
VRRLILKEHWPEIGPGDDVSDWLALGHTAEELLALVERARDYDDGPPPPPPPIGKKPPSPPPPGERPPWFDALRRDERGRVFPDLRNVLIALRAELRTRDAFHFDEMAQDPLVVSPPPLAPGAKPSPPPPHSLADDDVTRLQEWLQHVGMPRIGREIVGQAIEAMAREHRFHPLRDELDRLADGWDGAPRLATWLHVCLGTPNDEYHRLAGTMFLISMVARIYEPGCKADYMLVLEGDQGVLKSTVCRVLAGEAYFSDSLPSIDGDQVRLSMHPKGKWLVEVAELASVLRADPEGVKQYLSKQVEKYTPKYGRREVEEPRQCVHIGTTNEDDWIREVGAGSGQSSPYDPH